MIDVSMVICSWLGVGDGVRLERALAAAYGASALALSRCFFAP